MFNRDSGVGVVRKPMSFLAVGALGLSAVLVSAIVCGSGVALYAIRVADHKTGNLSELIRETARSLPEIRASLPPALSDAIDDERSPEYRDQLNITTKLTEGKTRWGGRRAIVEIENRGDKVVSMLTMRLVGLNKDNDPIRAEPVYAATPIQIDNDWRGPLLPRETRRMSIWFDTEEGLARVAEEVTEVRVWTGGKHSKPVHVDNEEVDEEAS